MQDNTLEAELTVSPSKIVACLILRDLFSAANSTTSSEPSSQSIAETFVYEQASSVNAAFRNDTDLPSSTEISSTATQHPRMSS